MGKKKKNKRMTIKVKIKPPWKVSTGHKPHNSGTGAHEDKRTKRRRTRSAARRWSVEDQREMEATRLVRRVVANHLG